MTRFKRSCLQDRPDAVQMVSVAAMGRAYLSSKQGLPGSIPGFALDEWLPAHPISATTF
jgi:hypothetical protein